MTGDTKRYIPINELDLQAQMTNPAWGKEGATELIQQLGKVTNFVIAINEDGKVITDSQDQPLHFLINAEGMLIDQKGSILCDDNDKPVIINIKQSAWGLLSYYTRDLRLGNLNLDMFNYTQYLLDLAGDCLRDGYPQSFMAAISRVITVLELSQSRGGFVRRMMNTLRHESVSGALEPKKTTLLGKRKR